MRFSNLIHIVASCPWASAWPTPVSTRSACQPPSTCVERESQTTIPRAPVPEPIDIFELPLPPVVSNDQEGSCNLDINPHNTGCIYQTTQLQSGSFTPDGDHVTAVVTFVGAPAEPHPASIYNGSQIILIKTDGTLFSNGDAWKCLTCGILIDGALAWDSSIAYPQAFKDGKRLLAGTNIVSCGQHDLVSEECTPSDIHVYPIYWSVSPDASSPSGSMRELRLHPDDIHLAWSSFSLTSAGAGQLCYLGRLAFNPSPPSDFPFVGRSPHYDLTDVNLLHSPHNAPVLSLSSNGVELRINLSAIAVGEVRGFSGTGREVTYIGYPHESCNIDVFAVDLHTGSVRRLTSHPDYADPVDISPDDQWTVAMDTRASGRQMFLAGMRHVPPIIDMLITAITASTRNNGHRRFFQPWLIDRYGDRGTYFGQQLNGASTGDDSGYIKDTNWNGLADPKFSPDGTRIVYQQVLVVPPACGTSVLPCPRSTAPGERTHRIMLARLTSRAPLTKQVVVPAPDVVPWGSRYIPGHDDAPVGAGPLIPAGQYVLYGDGGFGHANITTGAGDDGKKGAGRVLGSIAVAYTNFSATNAAAAVNGDDANGEDLVLNGYENVTVTLLGPTLYHVDWYSDLVQSSLRGKSKGVAAAVAGLDDNSAGTSPQSVLRIKDDRPNHSRVVNTKKTGPEGFHLSIDVMKNVFEANGTLTTTVDGVVWTQPENGA